MGCPAVPRGRGRRLKAPAYRLDLEQEDLPGARRGRRRAPLRGASIPIVDAPAATVWIWSDLHLGDRVLLAAGERPFATAAEMDDHLLEAWRRPGRGR